MKNQFAFMAFVIALISSFSAFSQQKNEDIVIQGYQYLSASTGAFSSPTITFNQPGGEFVKINKDVTVFQLFPGEAFDCRFKLPEKAFDVKTVILYNAPDEDIKARIHWNRSAIPEEQTVLYTGENSGLMQKEIPLKEFNQNNLLEIIPLDGSLQIHSVKILYKYRMPSCTVDDVTVMLLSPDPDIDSLTSDLTLTWKGIGPCENGWITIKYKDGDDWKTVPGAESFESLDKEWKNKFHGKFVWRNHALTSFPELKIEYFTGKSPKRLKADQFADNAIELAKEKRFDEAFSMIDKALAIFSEVNEYKNRKQEIANQVMEEAIQLANEKKYDDAIVMIDKALTRYPNSNEYKQVKQKIVDQLVEEAIRLSNEHQFDEASIMIDKALAVYPDNQKFKLVKLRISEHKIIDPNNLSNENNIDRALTMINKALSIYPENYKYKQVKLRIADLFTEEAIKLSNAKKYDLALTSINKALAINPDNNRYKQVKNQITADQYAAKAIDFFSSKKYDEALAMINESLVLYPANYEYKQIKQKICFEGSNKSYNERNYDKALSMINEALKIDSSNADYILSKRLIESQIAFEGAKRSYNEQNYNKALSLIDDALRLRPDNSEFAQLRQQIRLAINPFLTENRNAGDRAVKVINGVEFAFRWCPPGTFMMGSPSSELGHNSYETQHKETLTKGFWMMETEVTQRQWKAVMGNNPSDHKGDDRPVECVSWRKCQEFCRKTGFKLPTEVQWEYACRAGTTGPFAGNFKDMAWYCNSGGTTHNVKSKSPNPWGIYDMHGNVEEWCEDLVSNMPSRICRGGSWTDSEIRCRSAFRQSAGIEYTYCDNTGFRCIIAP